MGARCVLRLLRHVVSVHALIQHCIKPEEGVQAYGGSYSSVTSSGSIRYEFGVMRFPCSETAMSDGFEKQILAPTVPRCVHASDVSFEICVSQVVKSLFSYQDS